ncbi:MAG: hypothetical protein HXS46_06460 [Theionarchaea archaeon]|nr:MAG: hypothetical protein AYK18_14115 [Theionarchaea archaeon DG-70]MBU7010316.1 hypothetical protein [Theionarchaea archaeon]
MFEDIVRQFTPQYKEKQHYFVTPIESEDPGTIAAVDGGGAILWSNAVRSIGIILSGYIVYDEHHIIVTHKITQKEVLLEGVNLDVHRFQCELFSLAEAATVCDCVLFDGALLDVPGTGFAETLKTIDTTIIGISKKTRVDALQKGIPDTETLDYPGRWHYKIADYPAGKAFPPLGEVYIARLHERGPSFRVDVRGIPMFERLAFFSNYLFCLGYPYPLMEIHRATTLRDKKAYYQSELQKTMFDQGLENVFLSGVYHLEREREEFHQVLDGLV